MSKPVPITRLDRSAIDLRREASRCGDAAVVRRLLAIALVLEGRPRTEAAEACGMDRQTLRDWVVGLSPILQSWQLQERDRRFSRTFDARPVT